MNWSWVKKIHISWHITAICVGVLLGIVVARYFPCGKLWYLGVAFVLLAVGFSRRYLYLLPILVLGGCLIGCVRGYLSQAELNEYDDLIGKTITLSGFVSEDTDINTSGQIVLRLNNIHYKEQKLAGTLWVTAKNADVKRGDEVQINGSLKKGFGNFAGVMYNAKIESVVSPEPGDVARKIRDWFADAVRQNISEPEVSLGLGFLVGQRRALPASLVSALQTVGLTHVVVASGYNLTILVRITRRLFAKISKYLAVLTAGLMVLGFIAITGLSPSMSRAGLVTGLSLLAWYCGRNFHPVVLLVLAMAVTAMLNPSYLWGDLGWQLSFAAFAGVMILSPLLKAFLFGDDEPSTVGQILLETISAQILTMPIILIAFGQFSNIALIANLLVLPLVPLAMLLVFVAGIGGLLGISFAGFPAELLLGYMTKVVDTLASLPWASSQIIAPMWVLFVCYGVIAVGCLILWRITKFNFAGSNLVQ